MIWTVSMQVKDAILLIGPTGSGKTPLGEYLAKNGFAGRKCRHFDFGEHLRRSSDVSESSSFLDGSELSVVRRVLEKGALLEDDEFFIAEKILINFLDAGRAGDGDMVVLNGLPRHMGQARDLEKTVRVGVVLHLVCDPETVVERIDRNSGGDRTGRTDDAVEQVRKKLELFEERTKPLLDYYRARGSEVFDVEIGPTTGPVEIVEKMEYHAR